MCPNLNECLLITHYVTYNKKIFPINLSLILILGTNECEFKKIQRKYKPNFTTTFPIRRNSFDYKPDVSEWLEQVFDCSLMSDEYYARCKVTTIFASFMYPFINDIIRYEIVLKLYVIMFVIDDHMEIEHLDVGRDQQKRQRIFMEILTIADLLEYPERYHSMANWNPYCFEFYALLDHIFHNYNCVQKRRMAYYIRQWIEGNIEEYKAFDKLEMLTIEGLLCVSILNTWVSHSHNLWDV